VTAQPALDDAVAFEEVADDEPDPPLEERVPVDAVDVDPFEPVVVFAAPEPVDSPVVLDEEPDDELADDSDEPPFLLAPDSLDTEPERESVR
jgi:hypothetical protein